MKRISVQTLYQLSQFGKRTEGPNQKDPLRKKARIVSESKNTITILSDKGKPVFLLKMDVAYIRDKVTKEPNRRVTKICHIAAKWQSEEEFQKGRELFG